MTIVVNGGFMLTIKNLKVSYGNFTALNITEPISIMAGDRIGIIGSNGAGKTTLVKAISGLANYEGIITTELKQSDMALHLQENSYIKRMPVKLIIEAIFNTDIKTNEKLSEIIKFFDFESCLKKRFAQLSGGQKQKLTIILVLMQDKPLTFFDEVTSGLDFEMRSRLMGRIAEWYKNKNSALCIVSHYYDELEHLANKLLIIEKGKVAAFGNIDELFAKYCGKVIFVIDNNERNEALTSAIKKIAAPPHLIAFPCTKMAEENKLTALFTENNINYKRSDKDIEILFCNAVKGLTEVENEK